MLPGWRDQMQVSSKYMQGYVEAEELRIRQEIALACFRDFHRAGFRVSVSHDSENETEKLTRSGKDFLVAVFEAEYDSDRCWIFAAKNGMENPLWVMLVLDNVEDLVSDYCVSAEEYVKRANEIANKYQ
jgi:hypothetical protein